MSVYVYGYNNGGPNSYETFRVAWSAVGDARELDFRTSEARELRSKGLAGVRYVRGASARDGERWRANLAVRTAQELLNKHCIPDPGHGT